MSSLYRRPLSGLLSLKDFLKCFFLWKTLIGLLLNNFNKYSTSERGLHRIPSRWKTTKRSIEDLLDVFQPQKSSQISFIHRGGPKAITIEELIEVFQPHKSFLRASSHREGSRCLPAIEEFLEVLYSLQSFQWSQKSSKRFSIHRRDPRGLLFTDQAPEEFLEVLYSQRSSLRPSIHRRGHTVLLFKEETLKDFDSQKSSQRSSIKRRGPR